MSVKKTAKYCVEINNPHQHYIKVSLELTRKSEQNIVHFFMPSWSPGSYLMREYARNMRFVQVHDSKGKRLFCQKISKSEWEIDFSHTDFKTEEQSFSISYEVYCHELTVRTSHVDISHAFLHGPSYLIGCHEIEILKPQIEFRFPKTWSKLTTSLKDISQQRDIFLYEASSFDHLLDCPVEIGNQITDGFEFQGKPHHLAFYGEAYPHNRNLKKDIKTIFEYIAKVMGGDLPYEQYVVMTHLKRGLYGGLEHLDSTALQFDGRKLLSQKSYIQWLALVSHEYFHTWNVKRIRPVELDPFDYQNENYTKLLWLVEGLTSFVDELFVYQAGLCTLDEYLDMQKNNLIRYFSIPGRKIDSLESSSFDAWIKLYRPDENSRNSSVSYYLKGGLVFSILNLFYVESGKTLQSFLHKIWKAYLDRPEQGLSRDEVLQMIKSDIKENDFDEFLELLDSTQEIDFESYYQRMGLKLIFANDAKPFLGANVSEEQGRVIIKSVMLDSCAHQYGLNAGDEIIALNHIRVNIDDINKISELVVLNKEYIFTVSRLGKLVEVPIVFFSRGRVLKDIKVQDSGLVDKVFKF